MSEAQAFRFDASGRGERVSPQGHDAADLTGGRGFVWVHQMSPAGGDESGWLQTVSGLPPLVVDALNAPETRPRCTVMGEGVLLILRGVNLSRGAEPEDMVSLRLWITERLVVSVLRRPLTAVDDVLDEVARNAGPQSPGDLVARLALRLADRAEPVIVDLNERIDDLEDVSEVQGILPSRRDLADVRRVSIMLRRYMMPQRDALSTLVIEDVPWMGEPWRARLREATERVTRLAEDLDAIRDRAQVVHDQIMDARAEAMNRQMLILSVVAAVFLPLGLLTGLLGINVGGVPGAQEPRAFWAVCAVLVVIGGIEVWLFRRLGLLRR